MRKLAAIMFTDIVGYSALMSKDESLAMTVLEKNREIRQAAMIEHHGEFIKEIGDGTLCIFQSSWDAVNCAISIQKAVLKEGTFRLRIGIHIGDIVAVDNDIFGDGVNIASRIESICEPGGICFTQRVYEDIINKIDYKVSFLGEKNLKNIGLPLLVYSIAAAELLKESHTAEHQDFQPSFDIPSSKENKTSLKKRSRALIIIFSIIGALFVIFLILRPLMLKALISTDPVPIAVISFENQTGDSKFDYLQKAIPNLLITNLEQSKLFRVITWERMQDLLSQMGKTGVTTIDPNLGFDICKKEGCNLIVIGSYVKAGDMFMTDVKVLDVNTKQLIKSASARGTGEASILQSQIDYLSKEISGSAGIPYKKIETAGLHVTDVTSSSMEAYDYFLKGRDMLDKKYYNDAREYLERSVQLDSTFAVAWLYLSNTYGFLENMQMQKKAITKAYAYSARSTEKEQLMIKADYARIIDHNPEEELRILIELTQKYPSEKRFFYNLGVWYCNHDKHDEAIVVLNKALDLDPGYSEPLNQLAYQYMKKGMFPEALSFFRRYAALSPKDANPHDSMGDLLWQMGKLDESIAEFSLALDMKPDFYISAGKIAYIYAMKEDYAQTEKWINKAIAVAPSPGIKAVWNWVNAWMYNWCGNQELAYECLDKTYTLATSQESQFTVAGVKWLKAFMNIEAQSYDSAFANYDAAFQIFLQNSSQPADDTATYYIFCAMVYTNSGDLNLASQYLDKAEKLIPRVYNPGIDLMTYWYQCTRAGILLAQKNFAAAIEMCKSIKNPILPEFAIPQVLVYNLPFTHDFLARAYAGNGQLAEAITEYEKLITFDPTARDRRLIHPLYHYRLAKLYEETGQKDKAVAQYKKFLELWKNADKRYAEPGEAKKRIEALSVER